MKKCDYEEKYGRVMVKCGRTGTIRRRCDLKCCRYFKPTLRYRLFGEERKGGGSDA